MSSIAWRSHLATDKFKDACGVFGIYGHEDAAHITYLGLYALQHRGQESAGIAVANDGRVRLSKAMGYVSDVFNEWGAGRPEGTSRDWLCPPLDLWRQPGCQCPAAPDRVLARPDCAVP